MTSRAARAIGVGLILAPWAPLKVGLIALAVIGLAHSAARGARVPATAVLLLAGSAFWLAHIASPYWLLPAFPAARAAALALLVIVAVAWTGLAAVEVRWKPQPIPAWAPIVVTTVLTVICLPGLGAPLEFRGDEDVHLARPLAAMRGLQRIALDHAPLVVPAIAVGLLALALKPRWAGLLAALVLLATPLALAVAFVPHPPSPELMVKLGRYPALSAWLHTAAAFSPLQLVRPFHRLLYQEAIFRLAPLASLLGLAVWLARVVKGPPVLKVLLTLGLATTPVLLYYATALYLELPAVALITVGLYGLDISIRRRLKGASESGALLALALGLLLKESSAPLGLAAVAAVWLLLLAPRRRSLRRVGVALRTSLVVLTPIGVYLAWRLTTPALSAARDASFQATALANPELYRLLPGGLEASFGPAFLILASVGLPVTARRRPWAALIWAAALVGMLLLLAGDWVTATDTGPLPAFWGHSRMVLLTFPPLCCFAIEACRFLYRRSPHGLAGAAALMVVVHLLVRPFGWDGSRPAHWGDLIAETAGERYPYDDLYRSLSREGTARELRMLGRDYPYRDDFYLDKYGLDLVVRAWPMRTPRSPDLREGSHVDGAWSELEQQLWAAGRAPGGTVVAQVPEGIAGETLPAIAGLLRRERVFRLGTQSLVVYRSLPGAGSSLALTR